MNLFDMLRRGDPNLQVRGNAVMSRGIVMGESWRGLDVSPGSEVRIRDARRFYSLRAQPDTCGWRAIVPEGLSLDVAFRDSETDAELATWSLKPTAIAEPIRLVWPKNPGRAVDLVLSVRGTAAGHVFLGVHRALSRNWLYEEAKGNGFEIGPGPVPQILPAADVKVAYLEQMPPEEWNRLYNKGGKFPTRPELWDSYVVGDASNIPATDASVDFIYGSHVFEHLSNPFGHLERWRKKLTPTGKILCVIPDLMGTKDALQRPSGIDEWITEFETECWEPTPEHYERHMKKPKDSERVQMAIKDRESIHVHYYTNTNCQELLAYACKFLGYSSFDIQWTPNHKDFHFILRA